MARQYSHFCCVGNLAQFGLSLRLFVRHAAFEKFLVDGPAQILLVLKVIFEDAVLVREFSVL